MKKRTMLSILVLCLLLAATSASAQMGTMAFGTFDAEDIRGEENVTDAIFADAELTLVNFWTTWCPPCRAELPDLAQLSTLSEGRVQVLGVLMDSVEMATGKKSEDVIATGNELLDDAASDYATLVPDEWLSQVASLVTAVPTTFLVDSEGNVLQAVTGAHTAQEWLDITAEHIGDAA